MGSDPSAPPPPSDTPAPASFDEPVVVYLTPSCGYCMAALRLLGRHEIPHARVDVSGNIDARRWLRQVTGQATVPQIFIRTRSIGGYRELSALERSGELFRLLDDAQP